MKLVVALNGVDGCGKTTQASKLREQNVMVDVFGPLSRYKPWPNLSGEDLFRWWFVDGATERVIETIQLCLEERRRDIAKSQMPVVIVDRGDRMFEAVCVATICLREKCEIAEARRRLQHIAPLNGTVEIVFHSPMQGSQRLFVSRRQSHFSPTADAIYAEYQQLLSQLIAVQIADGNYSQCFDPIDSIETILQRCQSHIESELLKQIDTQKIDRVFALGGMSESGKSFAGEFLFREHGVQRLKIGYLLGNIARTYRLPTESLPNGVYDVGNGLLVLLFLEELAVFANVHYYQRYYSIESLHNFPFTQKLKSLLAEKLTVIYADAPEQLRADRFAREKKLSQTDALATVRGKDSVKASRGADQIRQLSDLVLDNSSSWRHTQQQLDGLFVEPHPKLPTKNVEDYKLPENYRATLVAAVKNLVSTFGSALNLLVVTGSGGREDIIDKWSDLDVLLVIDTPTAKAVEGVAASVNGSGIKVGTTTYTRREFEDGLIDSKTVYHNELIRSRVITPSIIDTTLRFPAVSETYRRKLHQMLLPNMLQNLRKHLQAGCTMNIHDTAKEVDTIMKYLVGRKGALSAGYIDTLNRFYELYPTCPRVQSVPQLIRELDKRSYQEECCGFLDYVIAEVT